MANFAELDENNIVMRVLHVGNEDAPDPAPDVSEPAGIAFLESLGLHGRWVQTSVHGSFRRRYGDVGYTYNEMHDVFVPPQPWPSWTLNNTFDWEPPTPVPAEDGFHYEWDEMTLSWTPVQYSQAVNND